MPHEEMAPVLKKKKVVQINIKEQLLINYKKRFSY